MPDHVHMCLNIPLKYSVLNVVGHLKGKAQFRSLASLKVDKEILRVKRFGLVVIMFQP